jgi:lysophospholipase L1-like esterase
MLPALASAGARYHAVYSCSRLVADYDGPLAYAVLPDGSGTNLGAAKAEVAAADLPAPVTPLWGLYDQTGGGRHLEQPSLAHRPRLRAEVTIGGRLAPAFFGIANQSDLSAVMAGPQTLRTTQRAEFILLDPSTSIQSAVWSELASGGSVVRDTFIDGATGSFNAAQGDSGRHVHAGAQVIAVVEDGAGVARLFLDGVGTALPNGQVIALADRLTLGASTFGDRFNANFRLGAYVAVEGGLGDADVAAVSASLLSRFRVAVDHRLNIVHIGDSIVEGIAAEHTLGLRAAVDPLLAARARWWNLGVSGKGLSQCRADRGRHEATLVEPGKRNVAIVDGGINDIGMGAGGRSLYADVTAPYVAELRATGYRVAAVTLLPQDSANYPTASASIEAERQAYNAAVRANAAGADAVIDRAAVTAMGRYPDSCRDPALYSPIVGGAALHPTTAGYRLLAPAYAAAINALASD